MIKLSESDGYTLETHTQPLTRKRGGAKYSGIHLGLLVLSTVLLTVAALFMIKGMYVIGVVVLILGLLARAIDTRVP